MCLCAIEFCSVGNEGCWGWGGKSGIWNTAQKTKTLESTVAGVQVQFYFALFLLAEPDPEHLSNRNITYKREKPSSMLEKITINTAQLQGRHEDTHSAVGLWQLRDLEIQIYFILWVIS